MTAACSSATPETASAAGATNGTTRTYFVAAEDTVWDYAPTGSNQMEGRPFQDVEKSFMEPGPTVIGRKAKKALYFEYTDETFTTRKPRAPEWEHLGFLGPLIRAQVGDTIRVVFRNKTSFPASMHPHGVSYKKDSEGAHYNDGTSGTDKADDGVPPGGSHTYVWPVPERAGPTEHEGSSAFWMYHSHVDEIRDVATGLIGPMVVTRRGTPLRAEGSPTDVDREVVAGFIEVDENQSWYLEENIKSYATNPKAVKILKSPFGDIAAIPDFGMYFRETINGFSYGHTPGMTTKVGARTRWYVMSSTNFEIHAPHWHGNVVTSNHMRTDVGTLLPMGMFVADMLPDNPGKWFFHCHVSTHLRAGMQATYLVQ
jgi:FtsP/CotA-like multicopper oxidase with cupredoxin domain